MKMAQGKNEGISLLKISQLAGLEGATGPGTKLLIVNTNRLPLGQQVSELYDVMQIIFM